MKEAKIPAAAAAVLTLMLTAAAAAGGGRGAGSQAVPRRAAVEVPAVANEPDEAVLGRPLALAFDSGRLFIADALDCAVKVFSRDGRFLGSFGRKGAGPGELSFPSGICIAGEAVIVADKLNSRIQAFGRGGRPGGGFKVPFLPDRILALGGGRLLVTSNPTGRKSGERLLHIFEADGRPVWEGLEARTSGDPVFDALQNMILVCPGEDDDLYLVFRSGQRTILHYSGSGLPLDGVPVDERHAFKTVDLPAGKGRIRLDGFCWAAARDGGIFYLSGPEDLGGRDLGPGRSVSVVDARGRLGAVIDLPCAVHRFIIAEGRMFAIDEEGSLRIFEVGP